MERSRLGLLGAMLVGKRRVRAACEVRPPCRADSALVGHPVPSYQSWLARDCVDDPWWADIDFSAAAAVMPPTSLHVGWYDPFLDEQLNDYQSLRAHGRDVRLCVGPWTHADRAGGRASIRDSLDWMDVHLRGVPSERAAIRVFVLGVRRWVNLPQWPPASTACQLHLAADGSLVGAPARASEASSFTYDPEDPTPAVGGAVLGSSAGAKDNRALERRIDVLTFTSERLEDDLTVAGRVEATLFVRPGNANGTVFVRVCDVAPRGRSTNITDGILRFGDGVGEVQGDGTVRVVIAMSMTACTFRRGHRIRLQVSGGAHPVNAGDPNCGKVTQLIHHDPDHPSSLVLPVLPEPVRRLSSSAHQHRVSPHETSRDRITA